MQIGSFRVNWVRFSLFIILLNSLYLKIILGTWMVDIDDSPYAPVDQIYCYTTETSKEILETFFFLNININ